MVGARGKLPQLGAWHYTPLVAQQWNQGQNHHASFTFLDGISTCFSPPLQGPATTDFARSACSPKTSSEEKTHFKALQWLKNISIDSYATKCNKTQQRAFKCVLRLFCIVFIICFEKYLLFCAPLAGFFPCVAEHCPDDHPRRHAKNVVHKKVTK
jgi:hypothetical protein